jgi:carbon storage regulator
MAQIADASVITASLDSNLVFGTSAALDVNYQSEGISDANHPRSIVSSTASIGEEAMLVLTRKRDEVINIGNDIVIRVMKLKKGSVRIGIEAPDSVRVLRGETINRFVAEAVVSLESFDDECLEECTLDSLLVQN